MDLVRGGDGWPEVLPSRLESGVRGALAGPVHADHGLEEPRVGERAGLGSRLAHRERARECCLDLGLVLRPHPGEDRIQLPGIERLAGRLHDRAIQRVAVRPRTRRKRREKEEDDGNEGLRHGNLLFSCVIETVGEEPYRSRSVAPRSTEDALQHPPHALRERGSGAEFRRGMSQRQERAEDQHGRLLRADALGEQALAVRLDEAAADEALGTAAKLGHADHTLRGCRLGELFRADQAEPRRGSPGSPRCACGRRGRAARSDRSGRGKVREEDLLHPVDHREDDVFLRGEVAKEGGVAHAYLPGDGLGGEAGEALLGDDLQGGVGDLAAPRVGGLALGHGPSYKLVSTN